MPTLHIVRKVEVQFPLVDEEGRFIRGGHSSKQNAGAADCSVEKMAAAIIDDVDRSLSQHVHVHIPSGSHDSHVGDDGTKTTTATTAMHPNDTGTQRKPNTCNHEQIPWKEAGKSVPRIEESNPSQPESSLPTTSLTSLRKYPSLCSKQPAVQTNTDDTVPIAAGSIPPPTRLAKNVVTQDGIVGNAGAKMVLLPAAGTSNASCAARAKRASFSALSGRIHPCDASNYLGSDDRASHLPPRKRLKYNNYIDALELLMKEKKAVPQKKKDIGPSHTTLPQFPVTAPIPLSESTETPRRIAVCTEEECDMAAALMSLPSRTPSSPSNSSSPKSTTITDGASLLSSIHNMSAGRPTGTDNNSGAAPISPASPTQPPLIFDIGAWFDQHQSGGRIKEEKHRPHAEPRESKSSRSSSEDESSKKRNQPSPGPNIKMRITKKTNARTYARRQRRAWLMSTIRANAHPIVALSLIRERRRNIKGDTTNVILKENASSLSTPISHLKRQRRHSNTLVPTRARFFPQGFVLFSSVPKMMGWPASFLGR